MHTYTHKYIRLMSHTINMDEGHFQYSNARVKYKCQPFLCYAKSITHWRADASRRPTVNLSRTYTHSAIPDCGWNFLNHKKYSHNK